MDCWFLWSYGRYEKMEVEFLLLWATVAALSLVYYLAIFRDRRRSGTGQRLPPGPRSLPVLGNLLHLRGKNLHHTLAKHARVHGPVMCLRVASAKLMVVVSSSGAAREAYLRHERCFAARDVPDAARALGWADRSVAWLPSSSARWRLMRGVVAAHVSSTRSLGAVAGAVRQRKVRDVVDFLRARVGRPVELRPALYRCMLNLLSSSLFSVDVADVSADDGDSSLVGLPEDLHEVAVAIMKPNISDVFPFLSPLDLNGLRRSLGRHLKKVVATLDDVIDRRIASASSSSERRKGNIDGCEDDEDFLDALLGLMAAGTVTRADVTHILFEVFGAGGETMATTVEWAMAELLRHPAAMARARAEALAAGALEDDADVVGEREAARLPFVQAALKESMRLHPVAPLLVHRVVADGVEVGGYAAPRGASLVLNVWAIMRDPTTWDEPGEFRPDRFLRVAEAVIKYRDKDHRFDFLPFGHGRKSCPGVPVVEQVMPVILATLLRTFDWRLPDGMAPEELDVSERFGTVTCMAVPLRAVPMASR